MTLDEYFLKYDMCATEDLQDDLGSKQAIILNFNYYVFILVYIKIYIPNT